MRLPKVTKPRFFILWGVGVVILFLITWKSFFRSGTSVQSRLYVANKQKSSYAANIPDLLNAKADDDYHAVRPPSSIVDAIKPKMADPQDHDLEKPEADLIPSHDDDDSSESYTQISNQLDPVSFLAVPHQNVENDGRFSSKEGQEDQDSYSQSSDYSSQDEQNDANDLKKDKPAKMGLFEEDNNFPYPPKSPLHGGERYKVAMVTAKTNKQGLSENVKTNEMVGQQVNPLKISQYAQGNAVDQLNKGQSHVVPHVNKVAHKGLANVVAMDTEESLETDLHDEGHVKVSLVTDFPNKALILHPVINISLDEHDKVQRQNHPISVHPEEKTNMVAMTATQAKDVPLINKKPINRWTPFVETEDPLLEEEQKQKDVPAIQPDGGKIDGVAMETVVHKEDGITRLHKKVPLKKIRVHNVEPGNAEFPRQDETHLLNNEDPGRGNARVLPVQETSRSAQSYRHGDIRLANSAVVDSKNSNVMLNQAAHDDNTADRNPTIILSRQTAYPAERLKPPIVSQPANSLELQQPKLDSSGEIQGHRSAQTRKVIPPEEETEEEFLQRMEDVQQERHDRVRQKCQSKYNLTLLDFQQDRQEILSWKKYYEHAYANNDHQFIICRVLKAASFSWRKVMISLYAKGSAAFRQSQKMGDYPMMNYEDETFISKLQNYKKILFVREPFARLLSAYRDKYVELRHFPYYQPIGMSIIQKYRKNPTQMEIRSGRPTFEEFTKWVINEEVPGGDYHWRPLFNWYHPCQMWYDFIGKVETAAEDARYIFKMIGIDKLETFPSTETHHKFSSSPDVLEEFYSQLSPDLLPQLINRYKQEFELFDYPIPQKMSDIWTRM
ncbi:uncharacterized protein LOC110982384 [Acanthaster planci]|uniref:Carbohydrate sulfotransferase n=1 Tax=Acanthaster planci TaxID=133434 RepID=A0A8B7YT22_ACAPL|nr:uncharacterized protein LOC110982384 [Acanthaster planci]